MDRRGFTLMELMLAVIVIAILVSIAIPSYINTVERARAREAQATLESMRAAELSYGAERRFYIELTQSGDGAWRMVGLENPNNNDRRSWNYTSNTDGDVFTATRLDGPNLNETITLTLDGTYDDSGFTP